MVKPDTSRDLHPSKPKYQGIVEQLSVGIQTGRWRPGDKLPSNRELAAQFGITIGTVSKAMSEAVRRGLVDTRVGSGTYIREQQAPGSELAQSGTTARSVDLSLNVLPISPVAKDLEAATAEHAKSKGGARLFAHVEALYHGPYLRRGAAWLTSTGTPTQWNEIVLTTGAHHGLQAAMQTLLKPQDIALCDSLCYTGFKRIALSHGVALQGVAGDQEGMIPDSLERTLREGQGRVLIANPVQQNPTAATMSEQRRSQIAALCRKYDVRVIEDGVSVPLSDPDTPSLAALMPERTIHLSGFSKTFAPGFRLGYARVPAQWLNTFQEAVLAIQWFPPGYFAELLEVMHASALIERSLKAHKAEASARQRMLLEYLPQIAPPGGLGYHAWLPLGPEHSSVGLCEHMRTLGVSLSAGHHFAVSANVPDGLRISLGACEHRSELQRGLAALAAALQSRPPLSAMSSAPAV